LDGVSECKIVLSQRAGFKRSAGKTFSKHIRDVVTAMANKRLAK